jgi:hypothetical protein
MYRLLIFVLVLLILYYMLKEKIQETQTYKSIKAAYDISTGIGSIKNT